MEFGGKFIEKFGEFSSKHGLISKPKEDKKLKRYFNLLFFVFT